jgi:hypothetical protein
MSDASRLYHPGFSNLRYRLLDKHSTTAHRPTQDRERAVFVAVLGHGLANWHGSLFCRRRGFDLDAAE